VNQRLLEMEHRMQAAHHSMIDRMNQLIQLVQQQTQAHQQEYQQYQQQLQQQFQQPQHRATEDNEEDEEEDEDDSSDESESTADRGDKDDSRDFHSENSTSDNEDDNNDDNHEIQQQAVPVAALPAVPAPPPLRPRNPQLRLLHETYALSDEVPSFDTNMPRNIVDLVSTCRSMGMDEYRRVDKSGWPAKYKIAYGKFQYLYDMATHDINNVFIGNNLAAVDIRARQMDQSRASQRNKTLSVAQFYTHCKDQDAKTKRRPRGHGEHDERQLRPRIGDNSPPQQRFQVPPAATTAAAAPTVPAPHGGLAHDVPRQNTLEYAFRRQACHYASYTGLDSG
jgi:hypothetical protein